MRNKNERTPVHHYLLSIILSVQSLRYSQPLYLSLSLCPLQQWRNSQTPRETVGVSLRKGNFNTVKPHIHLNNAVYPFH